VETLTTAVNYLFSINYSLIKNWLGICNILTDHELCSRTAIRHKN
jgi:hypothetical protein